MVGLVPSDLCLIYLRAMVAAAWEYARARNLLRLNPIHQEEEAKLVIQDTFEASSETGAETSMAGTVEMEDTKLVAMCWILHAVC